MSRQDESYWTDARIGLEILEPDGSGPRAILLSRPFGLIGSTTDNDVQIADRTVSPRHAYLHSDSRGIFIVDLATRTGTRFDGNPISTAWLCPGEVIEIGGRFIRIALFEVGGVSAKPPPCSANILTDLGDMSLCGLSLEPVGQHGVSWALGSELVFIGRGDSCGIRLNRADVANTHCALFRTRQAAFLIALPGQPTLVNGKSSQGAIALKEGDILSLGRARFVARVTPSSSDLNLPEAGRELDRLPSAHLDQIVNLPALKDFGGLLDLNVNVTSFPLELIPAESREAVLGWMLGTLHAGQTEIIRRQDDLQRSVALILQHIKTDNDARHDAHRDKLAALAIELARLEAKAHDASPLNYSSISINQPNLPALEEPRRPVRDLPPAPEINPSRSLETAAWLLERIDRTGHENKFSFRSFLARRGTEKSGAPPPNDASNQALGMESNQDDSTNKP